MIFSILGIRDIGNLDKERLVLKAQKSGDAGHYMIVCAFRHSNGEPLSGSPAASFWLPDYDVQENDLVVLYTKRGQSKPKVSEEGRTTTFHYWGQSQVVWNSDRVAAVIYAPSFVYQDCSTE